MDIFLLLAELTLLGFCTLFGLQVIAQTVRAIFNNRHLNYFTLEMVLLFVGIYWFYINGLPV